MPYFPWTQDVQVASETAVRAADHLPLKQEKHKEEPLAAADEPYLPAPQSMQPTASLIGTTEPEPYLPAIHEVQTEEPAKAHLPELQRMHEVELVASAVERYLPAAQLAQPKASLIAAAPVPYFPAAQDVQVAELVAVGAADHLPLWQE